MLKSCLIGEESELAFLAVEWRSLVNHFRVNFNLKIIYLVISYF